MNQRSRLAGVAAVLLLLVVVLSACGAAPVAQNWPGLTVADGRVYVISGAPQEVYILDAATGTRQGNFLPVGAQEGLRYWSPVAAGGDLAFVGFSDTSAGTTALYAFDPATGQERWSAAAADLILPAPVYAEGVVYFGDSSGKVYAVDAETGALRPGWPFQTEDEQSIWASPLPVGDRVYAASMGHRVYCLDAESGQEIWQLELGGAVAVSPVLDEATGLLYVGAFDGHVYAIDPEAGELVEGFSFQADNWVWAEVLPADDGRLYVTSLDGRLYALDPADGQVVSPYPFDSGTLGEGSDVVRAAPVQAGDSVVIATEAGRVVAVQNAQAMWGWPSGVPENAIYTTPVFADGTLYVVLHDGTVVTLNAENGMPGWTVPSPTSG